MDSGDYIYIIIAIVLAVANTIGKKKKEQARKKVAQPQPETILQDPAEILQELLNPKTGNSTEQAKSTDESWGEEIEYEEPNGIPVNEPSPKTETHRGYRPAASTITTVEYEVPFPTASEEKLYPTSEAAPLDNPENAKFTPIDSIPSTIESSIEGYSNELSGTPEEDQEPDMIFSYEKVLEMQESATTIAGEFDAKKALIYAEIITPKYINW
ncbi:MAG: hypothetical protein AB7S54_10150 [Bacteroidales bacterium]